MQSAQNITIRALDLLDQAMDLAGDRGSFEAMYDAAGALFFLSPEGHTFDASLNGEVLDAAFAKHVERLSETDDRMPAPEPAEMATLIIDTSNPSAPVTGNPSAARLLGGHFPCTLDALDLDASALKSLKSAITAPSDTAVKDLVLRRKSDNRRMHARSVALGASGKFALTLAGFEWTSARISTIAGRLDLTPSEAEVFGGLLHGKTQSAIAKERGRSAETVKVQVRTILRKAGVTRVVELAPLAVGLALLDSGTSAPSRGGAILAPASGLYAPERHYGISDGRGLGIVRAGRPGGDPVLYLHGLPFGPFFTTAMQNALVDASIDLVAPSRPGFGLSDGPAANVDFNRQTVQDAVDIVHHFWPASTDRRLTIVAHQSSSPHACRIAKALAGRTGAILMVGAGYPIDDAAISRMPMSVRVAAAASRHAPRIMELILRLGTPIWMRRGPRAYLEHLFAGSRIDLAALDDPETYALLEAGLMHMIAQGPKAFVADGAATMADWRLDYAQTPCPVHWIAAMQNPITPIDELKANLTDAGYASFDAVPNAGSTLMATHFAQIIGKIADIRPI